MTLPQLFVEQMDKVLQAEAPAFLQALQQEPSVGVRLNRRKKTDLFGDDSVVPWCADGRYLSSRPFFTLMPELHAGAFYVQDPSSMAYQTVAAQVLDKIRGVGESLMIADLCAAPGGKTTSIINAMADGDFILANEVVASRARILEENLQKWGYPGVAVTSAQTGKLAKLRETFDVVAVDAPCSGEGMMRKEEVAVSQWSPGLVKQCAELQRDILDNAVEMLKPGGYLIYSTCTFNTEENERQLAYLIENHGLESEEIMGLTSDSKNAPRSGIDTDAACYRFMPHLTRGEGLFLALLRKPGIRKQNFFKEGKPQKNKKKTEINLEDYLADAENFKLIADTQADTYSFIYKHHDPIVSQITKLTPPLSVGTQLAQTKGRDVVPCHALALSCALLPGAFPSVELAAEEALSYLRREEISLPKDLPKGYVLIKYNSLPLGFVKNLGNRCNSLYPREWRIRKG